EITSYTRVNGFASMRSVYYSGGLVMLLAAYNKTRVMKGKDTLIARFLDAEASDLYLLEHIILRPFVHALAQNIDGATVFRTHLFPLNGKSPGAAVIRKTINQKFSEFCGTSILMSEYRHLAQYF